MGLEARPIKFTELGLFIQYYCLQPLSNVKFFLYKGFLSEENTYALCVHILGCLPFNITFLMH